MQLDIGLESNPICKDAVQYTTRLDGVRDEKVVPTRQEAAKARADLLRGQHRQGPRALHQRQFSGRTAPFLVPLGK